MIQFKNIKKTKGNVLKSLKKKGRKKRQSKRNDSSIFIKRREKD